MFKSYTMSFKGNVLIRGFWLYIWKIQTAQELYLYVGRTGDSSSANASSPFARIGQHLDFKPHAKGNSIAKQLKKIYIEPCKCSFDMIAIGPLFPEEDNFEAHKSIRDKMARLECELAGYLKNHNYNVLGNHNSKKKLDEKLFSQITSIVKLHFPQIDAN